MEVLGNGYDFRGHSGMHWPVLLNRGILNTTDLHEMWAHASAVHQTMLR
jgi:hypothetical protein